VKNIGTGVVVNVGMGVKVIVAVAGGSEVMVAAIGVDFALGVAEALWQATVRVRHPRIKRSFFMGTPIKRIRPAV